LFLYKMVVVVEFLLDLLVCYRISCLLVVFLDTDDFI
jgi:hypothetical protein